MQSTEVDLLITGMDVVTFDDKGTEVRNGAIAIRGNTIHWIGSAREAEEKFTAVETIRANGKIAMPGLVDAHFHTAQQFLHGKLSALRRRGELKNPIWSRYLIPFESNMTPEDVYWSGIAGYASMISCGTTCFLEAGGPYPDEMGRAADEVGIRGRIALSTMDMDESIPAGSRFTTEEALRKNEELVLRWRNHPRVNAWLSLRQIMVNTTKLTAEMSALAKQLGVVIHTHLAEGTYEVDYAIKTWGLRPAEYMESIGALHEYVHAAHSVLLSMREVDLYAQRRVSACHCAFNNYTMGFPRVLEMLDRGIALGFGSDGAATRGSLDLFEVVHAATVGQQAIGGTPYHVDSPISFEGMLRAAVRNGARAARLETQIGSLEVGKLADLILVSSDSLEQYPNYDPMITLAEATVGPRVQTVIIDGRVVMRDRKMQTIDMDAVRPQMTNNYRALMERFERAAL
ncbi:MAG TPA: amidohydrolase family protein [Terracidiphilus sp.]|nr:amidohydrolase family protein [Terracidiphilus sp.]